MSSPLPPSSRLSPSPPTSVSGPAPADQGVVPFPAEDRYDQVTTDRSTSTTSLAGTPGDVSPVPASMESCCTVGGSVKGDRAFEGVGVQVVEAGAYRSLLFRGRGSARCGCPGWVDPEEQSIVAAAAVERVLIRASGRVKVQDEGISPRTAVEGVVAGAAIQIVVASSPRRACCCRCRPGAGCSRCCLRRSRCCRRPRSGDCCPSSGRRRRRRRRIESVASIDRVVAHAPLDHVVARRRRRACRRRTRP